MNRTTVILFSVFSVISVVEEFFTTEHTENASIII